MSLKSPHFSLLHSLSKTYLRLPRAAAIVSLVSLCALATATTSYADPKMSVKDAPRSVDTRQSAEVDAPIAQAYIHARDLLSTDPKAALDAAKKLPNFPYVDDLRVRLLVDAYIKNGYIDKAIEQIDILEKGVSSKAKKSEFELEKGELLLHVSKIKEARAVVNKLKVSDFKGMRSADRRYLQSRYHRLNHDVYLAEGDKKRAQQIAEQLLIYFPSEKATLEKGLAATDSDLSTKERFRRGVALYNAWDYDEARDEFLQLIDNKDYSEDAKWYLAMIDLRKIRDNPKRAEKLFKELSHPTKKRLSRAELNRAAESTYYYGRALMRQERYADAIKVFEDYEKRFPKGKEISDIEYYKGWLPYDHPENKKAIDEFTKYIKRYGRRSGRSSFVYGFLAWAYMREKDWANAVKIWDDMIPFGNPLVAGKAMYWKSYALDKLGKSKEAIDQLDKLRKAYPLTYYQMLGEQLRSKIETGKVQKMSELWWPERTSPADDSPKFNMLDFHMRYVSKPVSDQWERVKRLALYDEKHIARQELEGIKKYVIMQAPKGKKNEWIQSLGALVGDYNMPWKAVTGGRLNALTNRVPDADSLIWTMAYPRSYPKIVEDVATEFNLSPYFIWSIMRQESRYKPGAISNTNAVGALQMIPATAEKIAKELGLTYDVRTFFRPKVGFRYSGFYMRKLLDIFQGLYAPAAASYNSGPAPVARWFRKNPKADFPWLVEEFEYNEGRAYCRKVTEHMTRYLYLYAPEAERKKMLDLMYPVDRDITLPEEVGY